MATGVSNSNNHQRRRRNDFFVDFLVALAGACFGTYPFRLVDGFDPVATVGTDANNTLCEAVERV